MTDWTHAIKVLEAHKDELELPNDDARDAYLSMIRSITSREKDDHKTATQIAVDAAKTFVQIAIAFIVASVGFAQFSFRTAPGYVRALLFVSGSLAFLSMCSGFLVISRAYKRGDGREQQASPAWSTESIRNPINLQALSGLLSISSFVLALLLFNWGGSAKQVTITLPDKTTKTTINLEPVTISGQWSKLAINQPGFSIQLDAVPAGQAQELRFDLK